MNSKPDKVVSDYSREELARFRELFKPSLCRHRKLERAVILLVVAMAALICGGFVLGKAFLPPLVLVFLTCWLCLVVLAFVVREVQCPACGKDLYGKLGAYCPECGNPAVTKGGWLRASRCSSCGRILRRGKGCSITFRFCSRCGVPLAEEGLRT